MASCALLSAFLVLSLLPGPVASRLEPYDYLYDSGVEAYYRGDWSSVILNMEKALRNRELLRRHRIACSVQCSSGSEWSLQPRGWGPMHDLSFFERLVKRGACVRQCEQERIGAAASAYSLGEELELEFRKRSPYNYLQVAYFKVCKLCDVCAGSDITSCVRVTTLSCHIAIGSIVVTSSNPSHHLSSCRCARHRPRKAVSPATAHYEKLWPPDQFS